MTALFASGGVAVITNCAEWELPNHGEVKGRRRAVERS